MWKRAICPLAFVLLLATLGCGTVYNYHFSSIPPGATVYELRGKHMMAVIGTTPKDHTEWPWDSGFGYLVMMPPALILALPVYPLAAVLHLAGTLHGPQQFAAVRDGRWLSKPTTLSRLKGGNEAVFVKFDFTARDAAPVPAWFTKEVQWLQHPHPNPSMGHSETKKPRACDRMHWGETKRDARQKFGEPEAIQQTSNVNGRTEIWRYSKQGYALTFSGDALYRCDAISTERSPLSTRR